MSRPYTNAILLWMAREYLGIDREKRLVTARADGRPLAAYCGRFIAVNYPHLHIRQLEEYPFQLYDWF